jgi:hypothetical protein
MANELTTANGVEYSKYVLGGMSNMVGKLWNLDVRMTFDTYTVPAAALAATAEVNMGRVPKHARLLGFIWSCDDTSTGATTGTIWLGGSSGTQASVTGAITATNAGGAAGTNQQFISALPAVSDTASTAESLISVVFATAIIEEAVQFSLTTLYVMDK